MADKRIAVQALSRAGLEATYEGSLATADTHQVNNDGRTFLHFKKSGAGNAVVSLILVKTVDGVTPAAKTVQVDATTGDVMIGPFPPGIYNDSNHDLEWTVNEVTGLTVAAIRLP